MTKEQSPEAMTKEYLHVIASDSKNRAAISGPAVGMFQQLHESWPFPQLLGDFLQRFCPAERL